MFVSQLPSCLCFKTLAWYHSNVVLIPSDSDATPQRLADLGSNNSAIIGLAVVVAIVCIVAVASIILNVFQWKSR